MSNIIKITDDKENIFICPWSLYTFSAIAYLTGLTFLCNDNINIKNIKSRHQPRKTHYGLIFTKKYYEEWSSWNEGWLNPDFPSHLSRYGIKNPDDFRKYLGKIIYSCNETRNEDQHFTVHDPLSGDGQREHIITHTFTFSDFKITPESIDSNGEVYKIINNSKSNLKIQNMAKDIADYIINVYEQTDSNLFFLKSWSPNCENGIEIEGDKHTSRPIDNLKFFMLEKYGLSNYINDEHKYALLAIVSAHIINSLSNICCISPVLDYPCKLRFTFFRQPKPEPTSNW